MEKDPTWLFPGAVPNPEVFGLDDFWMPLGPGPDSRAVAEVAERLGVPVTTVDDSGYQTEVIAGAIQPDGGALAYVIGRAKRFPDHVDVSFQLELRAPTGLVVSHEPRTYNPFFGCQVRFLAWLQERAVLIYKEKHSTHACSIGFESDPDYAKLREVWLVLGPIVAHRDPRDPEVQRLALPELASLPSLEEAPARACDLWPEREFAPNKAEL